MSQPMSFADALNEARQVIVQQQYRIKADAEKIKSQQQTILDQSGALSEHERKLRDQAADLARLGEELQGTNHRLGEMTTAKEQADAVIDRQGQRLTVLQTAAADLERTATEQAARIADLTAEVDALRAQLPTTIDEEALTAMVDLLNKRPAAMKRPGEGSMRIGDVISEPETQADAQAQAA